MKLFFWRRPKPSGEEVVERVLSEFVTQEQLDNLSALYRFDDLDVKGEILRVARRMTSKYSMERCLEIAEIRIKYMGLDKPSVNTRVLLRHLFTRDLLKG